MTDEQYRRIERGIVYYKWRRRLERCEPYLLGVAVVLGAVIFWWRS